MFLWVEDFQCLGPSVLDCLVLVFGGMECFCNLEAFSDVLGLGGLKGFGNWSRALGLYKIHDFSMGGLTDLGWF